MSSVCNDPYELGLCKDCPYMHVTKGRMYMRNGDPGYPDEEDCEVDYDVDKCMYSDEIKCLHCDCCGDEIDETSDFIYADPIVGDICENCANDDADYTVAIKCVCCGKTTNVTFKMCDFLAWRKGKLIQQALPYLSADDHELMISSICKDCFPSDDEDEEDK